MLFLLLTFSAVFMLLLCILSFVLAIKVSFAALDSVTGIGHGMVH